METRKIVQIFCIINLSLALLLPDGVQPCKHCVSQANSMDPKSLANLRIEMVKQKILEKLRMQAVPVIHKPKRPIPKRLLDGMMMYSDAEQLQNNNNNDVRDFGLDEFYAKESQMVVFAELGAGRCVTKGPSHVACLSFTIPQILFKKYVEVAELHLNIKGGHAVHSLTLRDKFNELEPIAPVQLDEIKEGWLPVDLTSNVRKWIKRDSQVSFSIQVSCEGCHRDDLQRLFSVEGDTIPFLVINTETKASHRSRRGVECSPQMTHCCRESLFINFTDVGWDNWIIEPKGYNANYCKGQCNTLLHTQAFHHSAIIQESLIKNNKAMTDIGVAASCCAPTRMSSLNLLFYDGDGSVHRSILPNMSVDSCGCS